MKNPSFNTGFVTAITLFLEHKDNWQLIRMENNRVMSDLRLYGASDHLYDMEIPKMLSEKLYKRIVRWRSKCFHLRMAFLEERETTDKLFKEAEDILAKIDVEIFKTKKVIMRYR